MKRFFLAAAILINAPVYAEQDFPAFLKQYSAFRSDRDAQGRTHTARFGGKVIFKEEACLYPGQGDCECPPGNKLLKCLTSVQAVIHADPNDLGGRGYVLAMAGGSVLNQEHKWVAETATNVYSAVLDPVAATNTINIPIPDKESLERACDSGERSIPLIVGYGAVMPMDIEMAERMEARAQELGQTFDAEAFLVSRARVNGARPKKGGEVGSVSCPVSDGDSSGWHTATVGVVRIGDAPRPPLYNRPGTTPNPYGSTSSPAYGSQADYGAASGFAPAVTSGSATDPGIGAGLWVPPNMPNRTVADPAGMRTRVSYVPGCLNGQTSAYSSSSGCALKNSYTGTVYGTRGSRTVKLGSGKQLVLRYRTPAVIQDGKHMSVGAWNGDNVRVNMKIWLSTSPTATYASVPAACKDQKSSHPRIMTGSGDSFVQSGKTWKTGTTNTAVPSCKLLPNTVYYFGMEFPNYVSGPDARFQVDEMFTPFMSYPEALAATAAAAASPARSASTSASNASATVNTSARYTPVSAPSADPGIGSGLWVLPNMPNRTVADQSGGPMDKVSYVPGCLNGEMSHNSQSKCAAKTSFTGPVAGTRATRTVTMGSGKTLVLRYKSKPTAGSSVQGISTRSFDGGNVGVNMRVWLSTNPAATYAGTPAACRAMSTRTPLVMTGPGKCQIAPNTVYYFGMEYAGPALRFQVNEGGADFL